MTITLKDVAAQAKVAVSTVSLVLNGRGRDFKISTACIKRVQATAQRLGYRSSYHARTLKSGFSKTLGVVKADDSSSFLAQLFWSNITAGIDIEARARGYNLLLLGAGSGKDPLMNTIQAMDERRIDALIALESIGSLPKAIAQHPIPTVLIGGRPIRGLSRISFDPQPGLEASIAHLHQLGHRTIVSLSAVRLGIPQSPDRALHIERSALGLQLTVAQRDIEIGPNVPDLVEIIDNHRRGLEQVLPLPRAVTAVLCWNDTMALALISLLAEQGVRVPRDLSVIGFDDMRATHVVPALTTVSHSLLEQGQTAVSLAVERLSPESAATPARSVIIPSLLVIRRSTGPPGVRC